MQLFWFELDLPTLRFISGILAFILPVMTLGLLNRSQNRSVIFWFFSQCFLSLGSVLLLTGDLRNVYGFDIFIKLVFLSVIVFGSLSFALEAGLRVNVFLVAVIYIGYVLVHELIRSQAHGSDLAIFVSSVTSLATLVFFLIVLMVAISEKSYQLYLFALTLLIYIVLFCVRVVLLIIGQDSSDVLSATTVSKLISLCVAIFPVVQSVAYFSWKLHKSQISRNKIENDLNRRIDIDDMRSKINLLDRRRSLDGMVGVISHELSQYLTAILGTTQAIKISFENDSQKNGVISKYGEAIERLLTTTRRAVNLLGRIRSYASSSKIKIENVILQSVLSESIEIVDIKDSGLIKNFDLRLEVETIKGDRIMLIQFFVNLINNALQSAANPDVLKVCITSSRVENGVLLRFFDSGPGFSAALLSSDLKFVVSEKINGMGVGLYVCSQIIEMHGGEFQIKNNINGGAEVSAIIPS